MAFVNFWEKEKGGTQRALGEREEKSRISIDTTFREGQVETMALLSGGSEPPSWTPKVRIGLDNFSVSY